MTSTLLEKFLNWYRENHRPLPWRNGRDPYRIWISEIMLQQTTTQAVIPFFEAFLKRFPDVETLAQSSLPDVLHMWSGLGYYSRARNIHQCAKQLVARGGFPQTWVEWIELPGIGPYTARAISSFAFDEKVGVLDGNVIRFACRYLNLKIEWWKPQPRAQLQKLVDAWMQTANDTDLNQALIEIGATICLPKNPKCLLCPMAATCKSRPLKDFSQIPLAKPKRAKEFWHWQIEPQFDKRRGWLLCKDESVPFLKDQWVFPGTCIRTARAPQKFDCKHNITHHEIRVSIAQLKSASTKSVSSGRSIKWVKTKEIKKVNPSSLLQKVVGLILHSSC